MNVRVAQPADIAAMHAVRMSVRENVLADPAKVRLADYERYLVRDGRGWLCEQQDRVVGFSVIDSRSGNIWALFVHPDCEGRGIGRCLHREMLDWYFAAGHEAAWLTTDANSRAAAFYRRAGWAPKGLDPSGELRFEMNRETWVKGNASAAER